MCSGGGSGQGGNGQDDRDVSGNEKELSKELGISNYSDRKLNGLESPNIHEGEKEIELPTHVEEGHDFPPKRNLLQTFFDKYDDLPLPLKVGANVITGGMSETAHKALLGGNIINKGIDQINNPTMGVPDSGAYGNLSQAFNNTGSPHRKSVGTPNLGTSTQGGWGKSLTTGIDMGGLSQPMGDMHWGTNTSPTSGTIGQNIIAGTKTGLIDPISGLAIKKDKNEGFGKGFN
jgi:hypothetical protein